jgi:hypothetical protein
MGTTFAIPILLFVILAAVLGIVFTPWAGILAIPIVAFLVINFVVMTDLLADQRRVNKVRAFRNSAKAKKVDFTEEDKRTIAV